MTSQRVPASIQPECLRFEQFVLDGGGGRLLRDGNEIALRPKTFAVLRHLVENARLLISKEELFAAVWPNLAVTDDVLVQSIGELRRALGNDGVRLIKTVPRRGYRFDGTVEVAEPGEGEPHRAVPSIPTNPVDATTLRVPRFKGLIFTLSAGRPAWMLGSLAVFALLAAGIVFWTLARSDARWLGAESGDHARPISAMAAKPAIAVLPFVSRGDDAVREYFADGLTQDLIHALGRFSALSVMSWNAVLPYKGKSVSPSEVGGALSVRYQVEGRVHLVGDRVRVVAELVGRDGRVLWSSRFDEAMADIFVLQDKMITEIAGALAVGVTSLEQHRALAKPTTSLEAYDLVLRARPALQHPSRAGNVEARALLKRAIDLDPKYAAAYGALADTHYIDASMGWAQSPSATLARAEDLAGAALKLDETEVRARVVLGRIHILHQRYGLAKVEIDRAVAVNPSDAQGIAGRGNILMWLGETDAAIELLELAQRIDPQLSAIDRFSLCVAYYLKRRYDAAIDQAELGLRTSAEAHFSRVVLAAAYAQSNRTDDAAREAASIRRLDPMFNAQEFGTKFLNAADLEHLRDGLRKAHLGVQAHRP